MAALTVLSLPQDGQLDPASDMQTPNAGGDTFVNDGRTILMAARANGAGAVRIRAVAVNPSSYEITHHAEWTPPEAPAGANPFPTLVTPPLDLTRFGRVVSLEYPDGVSGLTLTPAKLAEVYGYGNEPAAPPALGASPGLAPLLNESDGIDIADFQAASADGDRYRISDPSALWIYNGGGTQETAYLLDAAPSDQGFLGYQAVTLEAGEILKTLITPGSRFGAQGAVTYSDHSNLALAAVRLERYPR